MKKKILTAAVACCLLFTLVACSSNPASTASSTNATTSASTADAATLERYDYVADMNGNTLYITVERKM